MSETLPCRWRPRDLMDPVHTADSNLTVYAALRHQNLRCATRGPSVAFRTGPVYDSTTKHTHLRAADCRFTPGFLQDKGALVFTSTSTGRWVTVLPSLTKPPPDAPSVGYQLERPPLTETNPSSRTWHRNIPVHIDVPFTKPAVRSGPVWCDLVLISGDSG